MKHLFQNQIGWLELYILQPTASKLRRLYLSYSDVLEHLNKTSEFIKERDNSIYFKRKNVEIVLKKDRVIIDGMHCLLTKDMSLVGNQAPDKNN